jgi:hypothetical protein
MGTSELLVGVMRLHEKMAWMLRSYIENRIVRLRKLGKDIENE